MIKMTKGKKKSIQTLLLNQPGGYKPSDTSALVPPLVLSTTYAWSPDNLNSEALAQEVLNSGDISRFPFWLYSRMEEPVTSALEEKLAIAEGAEAACVFASGMGAISSVFLSFLRQGDEIIAHPTLYGESHSFIEDWLPRMGIAYKYVDLNDIAALKRAISSKTKVVHCESPNNPIVTLVDISAISRAIKESGVNAKLTVDSTFATPFCQRPLELGADVVIHSMTKNISGFGTSLGGAAICGKELRPVLTYHRANFGAVLSAPVAWNILVFGLPTLAARIKFQQESAGKVAAFLESHPKVKFVNYPGLKSHPQHEIALRQMRDYDGNFAPGTMMFFNLRAHGSDIEAGRKFLARLAEDAQAVCVAVSLGHTRTLVEHPWSMTHFIIPERQKLEKGVLPGGMRLSIGLEHPDDIMADLEEALKAI